jgi:hypothetical protein
MLACVQDTTGLNVFGVSLLMLDIPGRFAFRAAGVVSHNRLGCACAK